MSLSDLTKEQKQYVILGVIVAAAVIVLIVFGVKISLASITEAQNELDDLTKKIESADRSLSKKAEVLAEFDASSGELRAIIESIPPERNYYSWASEIIYAKARLAGLEINAIDEQTDAAGALKDASDKKVNLESYSLRITSHGGFENVVRFLEQIEKDYPLVRTTNIDISTGSEPDSHDVQLFIQWPFNLSSVTDAWTAISQKKSSIEQQRSSENPKE